MRGPGRVGWARIDAVSLAVVLGAGGFWLGGGLGAGLGVAAGVVAPLLIERATRGQEAEEQARAAEGPARRYGPAHLLDPGLGVVPFTGREAELAELEGWCVLADGRAGAAGDGRGRVGQDAAGAGAVRADGRAGLAVRAGR